ncbi:MAG: NfeD family protein [Actinomycetota bacterium]|jgi:membrane protein implicated in regulation of membrane protease activity|nr:NfeD family protein [Actinomycetota bacterium]
MDWLRDHSWESWLIVALVLAATEMATLDFTLLMMAVGAGAGCLMAALGLNVWVQVLVAAAVAVTMLAFVRPNIVRRLHSGPTVQNGPQALVGQSGLVLERVTGLTGRVRLRGEVWSARAVDDGVTIEPGAKIGVADIDGATAVVYPL